ncbi:MAG: hypothetical protein AAF570_27835, partial [Bacteroidota bacterium]
PSPPSSSARVRHGVRLALDKHPWSGDNGNLKILKSLGEETVVYRWAVFPVPVGLQNETHGIDDWQARQQVFMRRASEIYLHRNKMVPDEKMAQQTSLDWDHPFEMPKKTGDYVLYAQALPMPEKGSPYIRAKSEAIFLFNVNQAKDLAQSSVNERPERIKELRKALESDKPLKSAKQDQAELDELLLSERSSHFENVHRRIKDTGKLLESLEALRSWLIFDRISLNKLHGDKDKDGLFMRLFKHDPKLAELYLRVRPATPTLDEDHFLTDVLKRLILNTRKQLQRLAKMRMHIDFENKTKFRKGGEVLSPVSNITTEKGQSMDLLLTLGEHKESTPDKPKYMLVDLTRKLVDPKEYHYVGEGKTKEEAIRNAFIEFG